MEFKRLSIGPSCPGCSLCVVKVIHATGRLLHCCQRHLHASDGASTHAGCRVHQPCFGILRQCHVHSEPLACPLLACAIFLNSGLSRRHSSCTAVVHPQMSALILASDTMANGHHGTDASWSGGGSGDALGRHGQGVASSPPCCRQVSHVFECFGLQLNVGSHCLCVPAVLSCWQGDLHVSIPGRASHQDLMLFPCLECQHMGMAIQCLLNVH